MELMKIANQLKEAELFKNAPAVSEKQMFMDLVRMIFEDPERYEKEYPELRNKFYDLGREARTLFKNEHREGIETKRDYERLLRWDHYDTLLSVLSPVNQGKLITDNNPVFNIVSVDELDISLENEPYYDKAGTQGNLGSFLKWMMPNNERASRNIFSYLPEITRDQLRMNLDLINPEPPAPDREEELFKLKQEIKDKAKELGFGVVGFTKVDRRYLADGEDKYAPYDNLIVLGMEMDRDQVEEFPNPGKETEEHAVMRVYALSGKRVLDLAKFIREKGWRCHPRVSLDGTIKFAPHAVNAGVANFATSGLAVTKEFGTRLRWCAITIEADLPVDMPKYLNVEEFCSRCRMCQKSCPVQAIPKEAIRYRGSMRRRISDHKCFSSMMLRSGCLNCIKLCPYSKFGYDKCMEALPKYYLYNIR